jgi:hypothetical protein
MRKIILLLSIIASCFTSKAQFLQPTPSTVVNGATITVKAAGESLTSYYYNMGGTYLSYTVAPPNAIFSSYVSSSNMVGGSLSLFNISGNIPTQFQFKAVNTSSIPLTVTFKFFAILKNNNTGNQSNTEASFTITINPTPIPPSSPYFLNNVAVGGTFYKNNCGANFYGSPEYYSIPAGTYGSTVSAADANSKAYAALLILGQAHANSVGSCTAFTPCIRYTISANQGFSATYQWRNCDGSIGKAQLNSGSSTTICAQQGTVTGGAL